MKTYEINISKGNTIFDGGRKMNKQQRVRREMERHKMANYIAKERHVHPVNFNTNVHIKK